MKKLILGLVLLSSCGSQRFYTDTYLIKMKDNTTDTLKHSYWDRFDMDAYKMEWMLKNQGINSNDVQDIKFYKQTFIKFKKNAY